MFTPLRVHSHGSLLYGVASPEALIGRALERGYRALGLADRDNLYLAIRFYQAAHAEGLAPLIGCTLTWGGHEVVLVAVDRRGYAHLCDLVTRRQLDERFDLVSALAPTPDRCPASGLHVVVESAGLAASLLRAGLRPAGSAASGAEPRSPTAEPRGSGGLWIGIRGIARERSLLPARIAAARELDVPLVATGDVLLLEPRDHETHRVAVTAAAGELLDRMSPAVFGAPDAVLGEPASWERRIAALCAAAGRPHTASEALDNNRRLVASCRLELTLGTPIFPRAPVPPGETRMSHLIRLCEAGFERRYRGHAWTTSPAPCTAPGLPLEAAEPASPDRDRRSTRAAARARLETELAVIDRMGFTDYFLLVAGIVGFARERGIPTVGRGSGASSIVAYVLGITNVDPIRYGLTFERFLHPARRDCPDLDIDLCWWRRDEVIDHVYQTYGHDRVAMISTHATLGSRSAFRETAKALGVPNTRVNALARAVPRDLEPPYFDRLRELPGARHVDWAEPPLRQALALAERLDGAPRHLSIHSGGLVIADRALTDYVPLERAAKDIVVTQFEMRAIEAIGLVKMDLLGNRALSTIAETVELAHTYEPERSKGLTAETVADGDAPTAARTEAGDTLTCFQLESPAMRHLLRMLRARSLDDVIAAVALVRPGPAESGMKEAFCRRARGKEAAAYLHPRLRPVLEATHGVMLYEEDVMRVAAALTGISLAESDDLRRSIGAARTEAELGSLERGFVLQAARSGVAEDVAKAVWRELTRFAAYAFCKAHAAGYGTLGFQSAWLRTHYPTEYAVAVLNHHAGMYATWVHVEDLRRSGVTFLPPCAWSSEWNATLERLDVNGESRPSGPGAQVARAGKSVGGGPAGESRQRGQDVRSEAGGEGESRQGWRRTSVPRQQTSRLGPAAQESTRPRLAGGERAYPANRLPLADPAQESPRLAVRVGLSRVFGMHRGTADRIIAARRQGPFVSLADFVDRVRPALPEVEMLIHAGALDVLGRTRPSLLLEARAGARAWSRPLDPAPSLTGPGGDAFVPPAVSPLAVPELPAFGGDDHVRGERAATGLWFSGHPLDALRQGIERAALSASQVEHHVGRRVTVLGLPCAYRSVETKSGGHMLFLTLADRSGLVECVLFPDTYARWASAVHGEAVRVEGRVDETLGAVSVQVERAEALSLGGGPATADGAAVADGTNADDGAGPADEARVPRRAQSSRVATS